MKQQVYVDTGALIAFRDSSDTHHPLFRQLFSDPPSLLTSSLVIAEGHAWFLKRYDGMRGIEFLSFIEELGILTIKSVGAIEIREASKVIRKFSDQTLSLADAVGLHLMQQHRIKLCWSTDHHLALTGVPLIIHQ